MSSYAKSAAQVIEEAAEMGLKIAGAAAVDAESNDYAMFSGDANIAVAAVVDAVRVAIDAGVDADTVAKMVAAGIGKIGQNWPEVGDTMVRETIAYAVNAAWVAKNGGIV